MADVQYGVVTEIGTFGSMDVADPTVMEVAKEKKKKDQNAVEESMDMDELAKKIMEG